MVWRLADRLEVFITPTDCPQTLVENQVLRPRTASDHEHLGRRENRRILRILLSPFLERND